MTQPPAARVHDQPSVEIAPGIELPVLGFGAWEVPDDEQGVRIVAAALEQGYRHIDTAQGYANERTVGAGIRASGVPRDEIFVTTKFLTVRDDPEAEAERSLEAFGLDHVDLYLVHDPRGGPLRAWPAMERVHARGLSRTLGVSNFAPGELDALLASASVPPVVNQIQLNPFAHRRGLVEACRERGITVEAYSPLTRGRDLAHPEIVRVAAANGRTPAQVMLRWGLQHGFVVLAKSDHPERQAENAAIFDFELSAEDMASLDALDRTGGTERAHESPWWL
jgi:2,5-diketo-D-gluconate reductase A